MTPLDLFLYVVAAIGGLIAAPFVLMIAVCLLIAIVGGVALCAVWLFERITGEHIL